MDQNKREQQEQKLPAAGTGNASNPTPRNKEMEPPNNSQFIDEKAEKYLRESANMKMNLIRRCQQDVDEALQDKN
jgi:hypothetical protein